MYDLILRNGTIVTSSGTFNADICVKDGKIAFIGKVSGNESAKEVFDAEGLHILPGIIDAHVHFRDPGLTYKEDFETGSRAAATGGVTCVLDMPNTTPPCSTLELFNEKNRIAKEKSCIDFGLFALLNNENTNEINGLAEAGAVGFKVFLGTSTGEIAAPCDEVLLKQMRICAKYGKRIGFHAETTAINESATLLCRQKTDSPDGMQLSEARPVESEVFAIKKALDFARKTTASIHIHHVTCKQGIELIEKAKNEGIDVTSETCPHYLFFNAEDYAHKVFPPIRGEVHRLALWEALKQGVIDILATDHAPHTKEEKSMPLWDMPGGLTGTEVFVNLFLNEVNKGTLSLNDFVRLASTHPAKIWGLKNKGGIEIGKDADFTVADMKKKVRIDAEKTRSKSKTSAYDGWELKGSVEKTIVRGRFVS